jgi:hypothetical protein
VWQETDFSVSTLKQIPWTWQVRKKTTLGGKQPSRQSSLK